MIQLVVRDRDAAALTKYLPESTVLHFVAREPNVRGGHQGRERASKAKREIMPADFPQCQHQLG